MCYVLRNVLVLFSYGSEIDLYPFEETIYATIM